MNTKIHAQQYHPAIKTLHWLIAALVFAVFPLGLLQKAVKDEFYGGINYWHVSLGFTLFLLMLVRIGVRFFTKAPARPDDMPAWESGLASLVQGLLYAALICEPILGYLTTNAQGFPLVWFDVVPIWGPFGKSPVADTLLAIHLYLGWVIVGLVVLHVCGALYRRVIRRDGTLARMT